MTEEKTSGRSGQGKIQAVFSNKAQGALGKKVYKLLRAPLLARIFCDGLIWTTLLCN